MCLCVDVPVCCPLSCSAVRSPAGKVPASSQGKQLRKRCDFIRLYSHTDFKRHCIAYSVPPPVMYICKYQWWESAVIFKCI